MRPGIADQLSGIRRILEDAIAPELRPGYPSQMLRGVIKNLAMLEQAWPHVLPFLRWDAEGTAALLADAAPHLDDELRARVAHALDEEPGPDSVEGLEERVTSLRGLLAEAIPRLADVDEAADVRARITHHLVERTHRYPFRMAVAAPTKKR